MTDRQKLWMLIESLIKGKIGITDFCDDFVVAYNLKTDYDELSEEEHLAFRKLNTTAARFTEFEEDLVKYPNVYYSENDVREEAKKVYVQFHKS